MLPDESAPEGFAPESGYTRDLTHILASITAPDVDGERAAALEGELSILTGTLTETVVENVRLRHELAQAEEKLAQAEQDREQAASLVADPDETVVLRQDIRDLLTVVALHTPVEFRPSVIMDRLAAAAGGQ
jgi:hypothetical protein